MASKLLINEWLAEWNSVESSSSSQRQSYAISVCNYPDLINDIFDVLEDSSFHEQYLDSVCDQLFKFYRSKEERLRLFTVMFIPTLIGIHLTNCCNADKKTYRCVDVLLLGIYNLEIVDEEGEVVHRTFRVPSLSKPSIFHEPSSLSSSQHSALTEYALLRLEAGGGDVTLSSFGPYTEYDVINCGNRMNIMTVLLKVYNQQLSSVPKQSYVALCEMATKVLRHGSENVIKPNSGNGDTSLIDYSQLISQTRPKVPLSSQFLVQLLSSVYFCMFNDAVVEGYQALEEIHNRAVVQLYADVLMMSMAIKNSLRENPSGQPGDGPMGISVALSPTSVSSSATSGVCKAAITNASFRTKKLPDDIPIVTATNSASVPHLASINEESEEGLEKEKTIKPGSAGSSKQSASGIIPAKIPVLQMLKDRKEKKKEMNATAKNKAEKQRSENGDVIHKGFSESGDNADMESDTSGISEPKSGYGSDHEMIPMTYIATRKAFTADDQNSNSSSNTSGNAAAVPLLNASDSRLNSASLHNDTNAKLNEEMSEFQLQ